MLHVTDWDILEMWFLIGLEWCILCVKIITERDYQNISTKCNDHCMLIKYITIDKHLDLKT